MRKLIKPIALLILVSVCLECYCLTAKAWGTGDITYPIDDLSNPDDLVPSHSYDNCHIYKDTGYDFSADVEVNLLHDGYALDKEGADEILAKCYQTFLAWGICREGAAAICGNIANESGGDPSAFGPAWSVTWEEEQVLDSSGKCIGLRTVGQEPAIRDFGLGLIEFTSNDWLLAVFYIAGHEGKEWTDLGVQLLALSYSYGPRNKGDLKPEDSELFKPFYDENDDATSLVGYRYWNRYDLSGVGGDISDTGSKGKTARLTVAYMANIEVCGYGSNVSHVDRRINSAYEYLESFKDLEPFDYSTGEGGSVGKDLKDATDITGLVSEWELTGMPVKSGLVSDLNLPSLKSRQDLSLSEQYNISLIGEDLAFNKKYDMWTSFRVGVVFLGLVIVVYALLMLLFLIFDMVNTLFEFSFLSVITFGKIKHAKGLVLDEGSYLPTKRVVVIIVIVFIIGCILISGGVLPAVLRGVYRTMNLLSER